MDIHADQQTLMQSRSLAWADFIARIDRPDALFYLDPPYWGHENDYGKGLFARDEFEKMAEVLAGIEGRFILSLNDCPEVRVCFAGFRIEPVVTRYSVSRKGAARGPRGEILIRGRR